MQLHEIAGAPLHLTLVAQNATDPVDGPIPTSALLVGDKPHARGIYEIPEFFFNYRYDAQGPDLEVPIGQIPLPNLVQGQTLAGDYGVLQSVTIDIVNDDRRNARQIALYANPRGGKATGTFVIDRVLVQAHAMPPFGHFKLRQYTIPPGQPRAHGDRHDARRRLVVSAASRRRAGRRQSAARLAGIARVLVTS